MTGEKYEMHHFVKVTMFFVVTLIIYAAFLSNMPSKVLHTLRPSNEAQAILVIITRIASYYCLYYNARIWDYAYQKEVVSTVKVRAIGWQFASVASMFAAIVQIAVVMSWSFFDRQLIFWELVILLSVFITLIGFVIMLSPQPFFKKYLYVYHLKHWIPLFLLDKKLRFFVPSIYDVQIGQRWKYNGLITDINRILIKIADIKRENRESKEWIDLDPKLLTELAGVDDTLPFLLLLNQYTQIANKFTWKDSKMYRSVQWLRTT